MSEVSLRIFAVSNYMKKKLIYCSLPSPPLCQQKIDHLEDPDMKRQGANAVHETSIRRS